MGPLAQLCVSIPTFGRGRHVLPEDLCAQQCFNSEGVELFNAQPSLLQELPQQAYTQLWVLRDRQGVGVTGFHEHHVGSRLPVHAPARPPEFLDGLGPGTEPEAAAQMATSSVLPPPRFFALAFMTATQPAMASLMLA